jgi:Ca2+/H+ antiporter
MAENGESIDFLTGDPEFSDPEADSRRSPKQSPDPETDTGGVILWPYYLAPFIPIAIVLEFFVHPDPAWVFLTAALGVIPTAALMGLATEELASKAGPGAGSLLNVTFGNAPEMIIAFFALAAGLQEVVKASIVGAILGNILLIMGLGMFIGGRKRNSSLIRPQFPLLF